MRRRRWTIGAAVVTAALIVAALVFAGEPFPGEIAGFGDESSVRAFGCFGRTGSVVLPACGCIIAPYLGTRSSASSSAISTSGASRLCSSSPPQQLRYPTTTAPGNDNPKPAFVLPLYVGPTAGRFVLGPAQMNGSIIKTAPADLDTQTDEWEVVLDFTLRAQPSSTGTRRSTTSATRRTRPILHTAHCKDRRERDRPVGAFGGLQKLRRGPRSAVLHSVPFTKAQAIEIAAEVRARLEVGPHLADCAGAL